MNLNDTRDIKKNDSAMNMNDTRDLYKKWLEARGVFEGLKILKDA